MIWIVDQIYNTRKEEFFLSRREKKKIRLPIRICMPARSAGIAIRTKEYTKEYFMMKKILLFLQNEDGQTSTEYILLVAVAALLVFKFKGIAAGKIESITNNVFNQADGLAQQIGQGQ